MIRMENEKFVRWAKEVAEQERIYLPVLFC